MSKVKIYIDKNESIESVEDSLFKSLNDKRNGKSHEESRFDDPAVQHTSEKINNIFSKMYKEMIDEISEELVKEYSDGN